MNFFNKIGDYFQQKRLLRELQDHFKSRVMPNAISSTATYPPRRFLGNEGIYAYLIQFNVPEDRTEEVLRIIRTFFPLSDLTVGGQNDVFSKNGESLRISIWRELNGIRFDLLTNSAHLLCALEEQSIGPPPPWIAFPRLTEPDALGDLQGDVDYWWRTYWSPFWDSLSDKQRAEYYSVWHPTADWIACIERYRHLHRL